MNHVERDLDVPHRNCQIMSVTGGAFLLAIRSKVCSLTLQGNINLIKAAVAKGVKRFVLVTSIGTGDSRDAPPKQVYEVLEKVLLEKAKAEDFLMVRLRRKGCSCTRASQCVEVQAHCCNYIVL